MPNKKIVEEFYKSDAIINPEEMERFLHNDFRLEWNSSKGVLFFNRQDLLEYANQLRKAYCRSKIRASHCIQDGNFVTIRYSHSVKTIENPREEILLANFITIWELKDNKLYKGFQISQLV